MRAYKKKERKGKKRGRIRKEERKELLAGQSGQASGMGVGVRGGMWGISGPRRIEIGSKGGLSWGGRRCIVCGRGGGVGALRVMGRVAGMGWMNTYGVRSGCTARCCMGC